MFAGIGGLIIWENYGGRSSIDYIDELSMVETKAGRVVGQVPRNCSRENRQLAFWRRIPPTTSWDRCLQR